MDGGASRLGEKRFVPSFAAVLRRFAPCVLRWKTLRVSSAPHPAGFESRPMGGKKARYREGNGLLNSNGAPSGIRTRDIHLERVASLAARRWGQRS